MSLFVIAAVSICGRAHAAADTAAAFNPDLIILTAPKRADTLDAVNVTGAMDDTPRPRVIKRITADSAKIISPKPRAVIAANSVVYEIEPELTVDSVMLFVNHSHYRADTLGVFSSPPYRAAWDCAGIRDQDQTSLQFGYVLYRSDTAIVSPPLPHRWVLDRGIRPSKKRYRINQKVKACNSVINCDLSPWRDVRGADIGGAAHFKLMWVGSTLHFIIQVRDSSVTSGDFVELYFDTNRERGHFFGVNHRIMRFSPLGGRARFFTVELRDSGFVLADSVNGPLFDETVWRAAAEPDGYIIEAAIPLSLLFGFESLPSKAGFDVVVMNVDRVVGGIGDGVSAGIAFGKVRTDTAFYSWAGTERFSRYNPRGWGTARISQAMAAIKMVLIFVLTLICAGPLLFFAHVLNSKRRKNQCDPGETIGSDPLADDIVECVDNGLSSVDFCIDDVLRSTNEPEEKVLSTITRNLDCTFDQLLAFRRIKHSQALMRDESLSIEDIAKRCGFPSVNEYREQFRKLMNVDPEISRAALIEKIREEECDDDDT